VIDEDWPVGSPDDAGTVVTSSNDPHGDNIEGNGLTGTSDDAYFMDEPVYVRYTAQLPARALMCASVTRPTRLTPTPAGSWTMSWSTEPLRR
jgi:hypothetical protein